MAIIIVEEVRHYINIHIYIYNIYILLLLILLLLLLLSLCHYYQCVQFYR